jgi:hypothetical protein
MTNLGADLLFGASAVADFVGVETRKVYHWMDRRKAGRYAPPVFDVGGQVCARRTELSSWFSGFRDLSTPGARVGAEAPSELSVNPVILPKTSSDADIVEDIAGVKSEQTKQVRD